MDSTFFTICCTLMHTLRPTSKERALFDILLKHDWHNAQSDVHVVQYSMEERKVQ